MDNTGNFSRDSSFIDLDDSFGSLESNTIKIQSMEQLIEAFGIIINILLLTYNTYQIILYSEENILIRYSSSFV